MVDYDPQLIGRVFEVTDPVPVTEQMVAEFCRATGDSGPLYTNEEAAKLGPYGTIVAPPSFAVTFRNGRQFFEHIPRFGRQGFDAGKDVEFVAPIRPGDTITLSSHVKEIYKRPDAPAPWCSSLSAPRLRTRTMKPSLHVDHRFMNRP